VRGILGRKKIRFENFVYKLWVVLTLQTSFVRVELDLFQITGILEEKKKKPPRRKAITLNGLYWK